MAAPRHLILVSDHLNDQLNIYSELIPTLSQLGFTTWCDTATHLDGAGYQKWAHEILDKNYDLLATFSRCTNSMKEQINEWKALSKTDFANKIREYVAAKLTETNNTPDFPFYLTLEVSINTMYSLTPSSIVNTLNSISDTTTKYSIESSNSLLKLLATLRSYQLQFQGIAHPDLKNVVENDLSITSLEQLDAIDKEMQEAAQLLQPSATTMKEIYQQTTAQLLHQEEFIEYVANTLCSAVETGTRNVITTTVIDAPILQQKLIEKLGLERAKQLYPFVYIYNSSCKLPFEMQALLKDLRQEYTSLPLETYRINLKNVLPDAIARIITSISNGEIPDISAIEAESKASFHPIPDLHLTASHMGTFQQTSSSHGLGRKPDMLARNTVGKRF